jgi:hypothetical protein
MKHTRELELAIEIANHLGAAEMLVGPYIDTIPVIEKVLRGESMNMSMKMKGKLAFCSLGTLGLITKDEPQHVVYKTCDACSKGIAGPDFCQCETGEAYVGIHLTDKIAPIGSPWSSRHPRVVGEIRAVSDGSPAYVLDAGSTRAVLVP